MINIVFKIGIELVQARRIFDFCDQVQYSTIVKLQSRMGLEADFI